jgi:hypothetical protein
MAGHIIQGIDEANLPEVSQFLMRTFELPDSSTGPSQGDGEPRVGPVESAGDYRWLLDGGNPARDEGIPCGEIIRNDQGSVVGMLCYVPRFFRFEDRRLLGLGAHNFYVDSSARMQGFFLFRRYLNHPRADFCFSTTCNAISGPLWIKCGAVQVPESDAEYLLVIRSSPVFEEVAINKRVPKTLASTVGLIGSLADLVSRRGRTARRVAVERCEDWDRLAAVADQYRDPSRLTPDRSIAELKRKYQGMIRSGAAAGKVDGTYRFRDRSGLEGWFSVQERSRGRSGRIRGVNLLDVLWPRTLMKVEDVLHAIIEVVSPHADLLSIRDRIAMGLRPGLAGFRRRRLAVPEAFFFAQKRSDLPAPSELVRISDFPEAFGV